MSTHNDLQRQDHDRPMAPSPGTSGDAPLTPGDAARAQAADQPRDQAQAQGNRQAPRPRRSLLRRLCTVLGCTLSGLLCLVLLVLTGLYAGLQTEKGQDLLKRQLNDLLAPEGLEFTRLEGHLPFSMQAGLQLRDEKGLWLDVPDVQLTFDAQDLPDALGLSLAVRSGHLLRLAESEETPAEPSAPIDCTAILDSIVQATAPLPDWVCGLRLRSLEVHNFVIERAVYDRPEQGAKRTQCGTAVAETEGIQTPDPQKTDPQKTAQKAPAAGKPNDTQTAQAQALAIFVKGTALVLPDTPQAWNNPRTEADLSLAVLPLTDQENAADSPLQALFSTSGSLPLRSVFSDLSLDLLTASLSLTGSLQAPRLSLETRAGACRVASLQLHAPVLHLTMPETTLAALGQGKSGTLDLGLHTLCSAQPLSTRLRLAVQLEDNLPVVQVLPEMTATGLTLQGDILARLPEQYFARTGDTASAAGRATSSAPSDALADVLPVLNGHLALDYANSPLPALFLGETGLRGTATLRLDLARPTAADPQKVLLTLEGQRLSLNQTGTSLASLDSLALKAETEGLSPETLAAKLEMSLGDVRTPQLASTSLTLKAQGSMKAVTAELSSKGGLESALQARLDLATDKDPARLSVTRLQLSLPQYACGLSLNRPLQVTLGRDIEVHGLNLALRPAGQLTLSGRYGPSGLQAKGALEHISTAAWSKVVPGLPEGNIDAHLQLQGTLAAPKGQLTVALRNVVLPVDGLPPLSARLESTVNSTAGGARLQTRVRLDERTRQALGLDSFVCEAALPLQRTDSGLTLHRNAVLDGKVAVQGAVASLWPLARQPNMRLSGRFGLNATVGGTLGVPQIKGELVLAKGLFNDVEYGIQIKDIAASAALSLPGSLEQGRVQISLSARDGRRRSGLLNVKGQCALTGRDLHIEASLDRFSPLHRRDIRAMLSGTCRVSGSALDPQITGRVTIDRGRIRLDALEVPSSVTTLPLVEGPKERILAERHAVRQGQGDAGKAKPALPGSLNVALGMSKFFVTGYGFRSEWKADLTAKGPLSAPAILGQVEAVRGDLDLLNRHFELKEGTVRFAGGLEPMLKVEMTSSVKDIETAVVVSGTPAKLDFTLKSNPMLPRQDILAYMLFGKPSNELSQFELLRLGTTAASFAAFGTTSGGITSLARQVMGLDVLNVSQNDGSTRLEMGRYIMDNVYVGLEQGTDENSDTSAVIQIELGPRTSATMKTGSDNTSAGLKWKMDY